MNCGFEFQSNKVNMKPEAIQNRCLGLDQKSLSEFLKQNRSSALTHGICLGIGFVFIVFGVAIPIVLHERNQTINGLLAIIGGILVSIIGGVMEVYHWARLSPTHLEKLGETRGTVPFRCSECERKTGHVLIDFTTGEDGQMRQTYECQECGETKQIYELSSAVELPRILEPMNITIKKKKK